MVVFVNIMFLKVVSNFFAFIFAFFKHMDFNLTNKNFLLQSYSLKDDVGKKTEALNL